MTLLSQIPAPPSGAMETWLLSFAAIASIAVLAKKLFLQKPRHEPEFVTKTEFHQEMTQFREKLDAGFLRTRSDIDETKAYLALSGERHADSIHRRLNKVETLLARVDERTKPAATPKPKQSDIQTISY